MVSEIITALITGGLALVGVIISNNHNNAKIQAKLETAQAVTDCKIEELTRETRKHNNFGERIPVIEEQIKVINHRVKDIENELHTHHE